jgi:hypothetical protein
MWHIERLQHVSLVRLRRVDISSPFRQLGGIFRNPPWLRRVRKSEKEQPHLTGLCLKVTVSEVCLLVDKLLPGDCRKRSVRNDKSIGKGNTYMWVSVKWKTEVKTDGPPRLGYNGLNGELEHLKIETRLRDESLGCVMVECVCLHKSSIFNVIRSPAGLTRMWPTLDLICEENDIQRQTRTGTWSENQAEDLDRHVSAYPSGPHKLIHSSIY